jgi:iduronate 2-sulfatase
VRQVSGGSLRSTPATPIRIAGPALDLRNTLLRADDNRVFSGGFIMNGACLRWVAAISVWICAGLTGPAPPWARSPASAGEARRPNVLFIAVDDLRPELGCYGQGVVRSPNIDRLARQGVQLMRAYCQVPLCGPTRTSLLTGLRPDTTGVVHNHTHFRERFPDLVTLPEHFKSHGYHAVNMGKIFHGGLKDPRSWSEPFRLPPSYRAYPQRPVGGYQLPENRELVRRKQEAVRQAGLTGPEAWGMTCGPATEAADVPDGAYQDGVLGEMGAAAIRRFKGRPFFIAVGFYKPHLPFVAPKRYWDLYDPAEIRLARNPFPPANCPPLALPPSIELRAREGIPKIGPIPDELARRLIHGYLACVSYVDAQIGRLLDELERQGLHDETIVVLWGDHGWQLGEHALWGKASNFETSARVPLIVDAPGLSVRGRKARGLVEFVDLYPTLCELAGLPLPGHLEGTSFAPLLRDPDRAWKSAALTQYPCPALREWAGLPLEKGMRGTFAPLMEEVQRRLEAADPDDYRFEAYNEHVMGYSMRTDRYRLVLWVDDQRPDRPVAVELYDHQADPDENVNVASDPANRRLVEELTRQLKAGWQAALPEDLPKASPKKLPKESPK